MKRLHGPLPDTLAEGSFGKVETTVPRARLNASDGKTTESRSKALRAFQRRTVVAAAVIMIYGALPWMAD